MGLDNGDRTFLGEYAYLTVAFRFSYYFPWVYSEDCPYLLIL
jgi:hypothetical protein